MISAGNTLEDGAQVGDDPASADSSTPRGALYGDAGLYDRAVFHYARALELAIEAGDA